MHTSIMKMVLGLPSRYLVTAILTVSALAVDGGGPFLSAADLTIRLLGDKAIQRQVVSYSCDHSWYTDWLTSFSLLGRVF